MSKVLQRAMFKQPQHEHRSTGIASGLEYREGYAVGGQVTTPKRGLVDGPGGYAGHNINLPANTQVGGIVNPSLSMGSGLDIDATKQLAELMLKDVPKTDFSQFAIDYTDPALAVDYSKTQGSAFSPIGTAAGRTIADPIPEGQSQFATFVGNLSADAADYAARRKELDLLSQAQRAETALKMKEQSKELGLLSAEQDRSTAENIAGLTTNLAIKQLDLMKEKQPNAFTFINKSLIAQGIDPDKPEEWGEEGTKIVMDTLALATGEPTESTKQFQLKKQKLSIMSELLRTLPDNVKKKIFEGGGEYDNFVSQYNNLMVMAGLDPVSSVSTNQITMADNAADLSRLAEGSELPNLLANSGDLLSAAADDDALAKTVIKAQEAQRRFFNGELTVEQFTQVMEKINANLLQAGQDTFNLDLLK
jgi:hypothetical protein